jgi:cell wall-associated NlpC family hydrolase
MAGEVPRRRRIAVARLAPADLLFFGTGGRRAKAAQVDHMAIYLGNGWLIHSSRFGVALAPVEGWYAERLAWGRRPLAEAGL